MNSKRIMILTLLFLPLSNLTFSQDDAPHWISNTSDNLDRLSEAKFFSINPDIPTGKKGSSGVETDGAAANASRDLGQGWKEKQVKFFLDGDREFPTMNGTGTEDYFNGSYDFEHQENHRYQEFTSPYSGLVQVIRPDGLYQSQIGFGTYRWRIPDPIRFDRDLRVTIQDLKWKSGGRYLPLMDDISSVAYWYQTAPHKPLPQLPERDFLEDN
jgi:hypothetical protein